jgi:hypothetical protein
LTTIYHDRLAGWIRSGVRDFASWLNEGGHSWQHGARGVIGEWGVPGPDRSTRGGTLVLQTEEDKNAWEKIARWYLRELARQGLKGTWWAAGAGWDQVIAGDRTDYSMLAFGAPTHDAPLSVVHRPGRYLIEAARPYEGLNGVNLAGWEWGDTSPLLPANFTFLGTYGVRLVRVPFRWDTLQAGPGMPLTSASVAALTMMLNAAASKRVKVILDCHQGGQAYRDGGGRLSEPQLSDLWVRMAKQFGNHPGVGYLGIMNEPNNEATGFSGDVGPGREWWVGVTKPLYAKIRAVDPDVPILMPTWDHSNVHRVRVNHPNGPWLDPEPNLWWEAHHYFDPWNGGSYSEGYADYLNEVPAGTSLPAREFVEDL